MEDIKRFFLGTGAKLIDEAEFIVIFCLFQRQLDSSLDTSHNEQMSDENVDNKIEEIVNNSEGMSDVNNVE